MIYLKLRSSSRMIVPFDGEYLCKSHINYFAVALVGPDILMFQVCHLENLSQIHEVQHSQWFHSLANNHLHNSRNPAFFALTVFEIFTSKIS